MINENMKKVLVALRSGEYTQAKETLQDSSGHCCLGVMCEVYEKETGDKLPRNNFGNIIGVNLCDLPLVKVWVGLDNDNNAGNSSRHISSLVYMNDDEGKSFSEIADFIESDPKGLLV
jgi:hypothetical protein